MTKPDPENLGMVMEPPALGVRTLVIHSYEIPRHFYKTVTGFSPVKRLGELGVLIWWADHCGYTAHKKRTPMDVDKLVAKWAKVITGLATVHDKDQADRYEAAIEDCLTPILAAPIKQVREFYPKLLKVLKAEPTVPFLVWRSYEIWVEQILAKAPDEKIKKLKTVLAKEIADLVEQDVKDQIPEALMRALQWRDEKSLAEVKEAVEETKANGGKVRLKGRESCLFMEAGGTDDEPKACIQI